MKNTLGDLTLHLFAEMERLGDEELKGESLKEEMERARAISVVAKQIIDNAALVLDAQKAFNIQDRLNADAKIPKMLEG